MLKQTDDAVFDFNVGGGLKMRREQSDNRVGRIHEGDRVVIYMGGQRQRPLISSILSIRPEAYRFL